MKKRAIFVAVAIAAFSATLAISHAVNSQNWVGYAKVQVPPAGQFTMVGVNFEAVGGGGVPLNELISTNSLTGDPFFTKADNVFIYDPSKPGYNSFYYDGGTWKDTSTFAPTNPIVHSGDAFWLQSSTTSTETNEVYVTGQVSLDNTQKQVMVTSFQQFSNPYPVDLNLNSNKNWATSGATGNAFFTQADNIFIWNGTGYDSYYFGADEMWHDATTFEVATNAVIPVGAGAWYQAQNSFTNVLERPFDAN